MTIHVASNKDQTPVAFRSVATPVAKQEMELATKEQAASILRRVLADAFTLYLRAHGYHWNVAGPDFAQYHELFGEIYEDVASSIDPIAESIRKLEGYAPFRLPELMALRSIPDVPVSSNLPAAMVIDLLAANEQMLVTLNDAFAMCTAANQQGIANFVSERIDQHQKWSWQLRSSAQS